MALLLLAVSLLLVAGILLAYAGGDDSSSAARPPSALNAHWAGLVHAGEEQLRTARGQSWPFDGFRGKGEEMPERMRRSVAETLGGAQPLHLRFEHVYRVRTTTGVRVWVVRGRGVVCIVRDVKASVACDTDVNAAHRGLVLGVYKVGPPPQRKPTQFLMLGIAPDSVRAVRVKIKGAAPRMARVVENTFSLRSKSPIAVEAMIR
jgi:hypothetical protein